MSTRKLIAMAMVCLVAVVVAGGIKLFQITGDDVKVEVLDLGETATVGEMTVSVLSIKEVGDQTVIEVSIGGVADPDGAASWRLLTDGKLYEPVVGMEPDQCVATTVEMQTCSVVFDGVGVGVSVAYSRAGEQKNWAGAKNKG